MNNEELKIITDIAEDTIAESITDGMEVSVFSIEAFRDVFETKKSDIPLEYYHGAMDVFNYIIKELKDAIVIQRAKVK